MVKLLTQNRKMKRSGNNAALVFNFGIPAIKTCPSADACKTGCYAAQGAYTWPKVRAAYEARLKVTKQLNFKELISKELETLYKRALKLNKKLYIRVHDSGDFYDARYQIDWYNIAATWPEIEFYAYTKMVAQSVALSLIKPDNFKLIYSYGGKQDHLIRPLQDRHSRVFETEKQLIKEAYDNITNNDLMALDTLKVGLVYHGQRGYNRTKWKEVIK